MQDTSSNVNSCTFSSLPLFSDKTLVTSYDTCKIYIWMHYFYHCLLPYHIKHHHYRIVHQDTWVRRKGIYLKWKHRGSRILRNSSPMLCKLLYFTFTSVFTNNIPWWQPEDTVVCDYCTCNCKLCWVCGDVYNQIA